MSFPRVLVAMTLAMSTVVPSHAQTLISASSGNAGINFNVTDTLENLTYQPESAVRVTRTIRLRYAGRERNARLKTKARKLPQGGGGAELTFSLVEGGLNVSLSGGYYRTFPLIGGSIPVWAGPVPVTIGVDIGVTVGASLLIQSSGATLSGSLGLGATAYGGAGIGSYAGFRVMAGVEATGSPFSGTVQGTWDWRNGLRLRGNTSGAYGATFRLAGFAQAGWLRWTVELYSYATPHRVWWARSFN